MIVNLGATQFGLEGEVYFNLFGRSIKVMIDEDVCIDYANRCAAYLNSLSDEVVNELWLASIRYCNDFLETIGEEVKVFEKPSDVRQFIHPSSLMVSEPCNGDEPVIDMELNCDWEIEHGMQWIIRQDKVLYVGAYNGESHWGDYTVKDSWNYA